MKLLHLEPLRAPAELRSRLEAVAEVTYLDELDPAALRATFAKAPWEAVFTRLGVALDAAALASLPALRFVVTPTTGLDHIDVPTAEARGVRVLSLRGETAFLDSIRSTAEHTWALLLALARRLPAAHRAVTTERAWVREPFLAEELAGRTLGVLGFGRLGRMVAGYGRAFGMRVLVHDTNPDQLLLDPLDCQAVGADELLAQADVLSLHLPLTPQTAGYLDERRFSLLRPGALLVNTARGELVDERALLESLRSARLAGAALDVLAGDGSWATNSPPDHPLVAFAANHGNLLITPHVGGYGRQSIERTRSFVLDKFLRAVAERPPR